jgi:hypothetical protein
MKELFLIAALSAHPVSFNPPLGNETKFSEADKQFFAYLREYTNQESKTDIAMVSVPIEDAYLGQWFAVLDPGGFLIIKIGQLLGYELILQMANFQKLPFTWRGYQIWRKPVLSWAA